MRATDRIRDRGGIRSSRKGNSWGESRSYREKEEEIEKEKGGGTEEKGSRDDKCRENRETIGGQLLSNR